MKYPNNLRTARDLRNMTQQQVADAIGVTINAYQNYEYGRRDIRSTVLARLARALGCSADYLLGLDSEPRPLPATSPELRMLPVATHSTKIDASGQPIGSDRTQEVTNTLYQSHEDSWWMVVATHSMDRVIPEGSLVLIDPTLPPRSGDIAAAVVDGGDAVLRRVLMRDGDVLLRAESHDYDFADLLVRQDEVRLLGRVVSYSADEPWRV